MPLITPQTPEPKQPRQQSNESYQPPNNIYYAPTDAVSTPPIYWSVSKRAYNLFNPVNIFAQTNYYPRPTGEPRQDQATLHNNEYKAKRADARPKGGEVLFEFTTMLGIICAAWYGFIVFSTALQAFGGFFGVVGVGLGSVIAVMPSFMAVTLIAGTAVTALRVIVPIIRRAIGNGKNKKAFEQAIIRSSNMDYEEMYKISFNAMTDAIKILTTDIIANADKSGVIMAKSVHDAVSVLTTAQQKTEEMYIKADEPDEA